MFTHGMFQPFVLLLTMLCQIVCLKLQLSKVGQHQGKCDLGTSQHQMLKIQDCRACMAAKTLNLGSYLSLRIMLSFGCFMVSSTLWATFCEEAHELGVPLWASITADFSYLSCILRISLHTMQSCSHGCT